MLKILIVDNDNTLRLTMRGALEHRGYQIDEADDGEQAMALLRERGPYDAVFLDTTLPGLDGTDALAKIRDINPKTSCVILTANSSVKEAVSSIKEGAYDYLEKPVKREHILTLIDTALEANEMAEVAAYSAPHVQFTEGKNMIGESPSIRKVFDLIYKLAKVETSVLIRGESGTGKELVAQALHYNSRRKKGPFVAVNCGAIPENLIESELFGHEKGSFTSADKRKIGKFQYAAGGTIFLDEIGDVSLPMQVKLLRVLQEKKFTPVGSNQELDADVRIISATNRNLEKHIDEDKFRPDLFYRINVLPIYLPPLRERREDIKRLVDFMIDKFNIIHNKNIKGIDRDALSMMIMYRWPGNIRELENVIEHAFIMESSDRLGVASLPSYIQTVSPTQPTGTAMGRAGAESLIDNFSDLNYPILKERFEKEFIQRALQAFNGRINQTAEHTQMTKVTLLRKLEKYGINPRDFKQD